jgi:hypothetical protein
MVHDSWVQTAVSAVKASCAVREIRKVPSEVCVVAAAPTAASGDAPSIVTETVRPLTVPDTVLSGGAVEDDGDVELPPQAAKVPAVITDAA